MTRERVRDMSPYDRARLARTTFWRDDQFGLVLAPHDIWIYARCMHEDGDWWAARRMADDAGWSPKRREAMRRDDVCRR